MTTTAGATELSSADGRDLTLGLAGAAVAVCAWSAGTILAKGIEMGGLAIGAYRFWIFSAMIVVWMAVRGTPFTWRVIKLSVWGGVALGSDIALFFSAVKETSIVNATIIGSLQPILVGAVAAKFFGEKIRARDAIWSVVALAGVVVIIGTSADDTVSNWRGDLLAVGALLSWSGYFIASKQSKGKMTSLEFTAGTSVWSGLICTPLGFLFGQDMSLPSAKNLGLLLVMIAVSGVVGHVLMNWSLVRIPLWIGSTFTLLIPVFSALLAWVFFDESILPVQGIAMAAVIGSLAIVVRGQSSAAKATAAHKAVLDDGVEDGVEARAETEGQTVGQTKGRTGGRTTRQTAGQTRVETGGQARSDTGVQARSDTGVPARAETGARTRTATGVPTHTETDAIAGAEDGTGDRREMGIPTRTEPDARTGTETGARTGPETNTGDRAANEDWSEE